ncbi:AraC family transcriptional regulator [Pseudonocardia hierapolitana]|uniref:AraC family transcriptional regulator n=1 Tax=Pseudonocardia hierapolitana TaxID=1128676 RepID=A0A561T3L3_9PSEU|nr:AraC family transcriptional regulator [Pseudonocardia hierapolitana]
MGSRRAVRSAIDWPGMRSEYCWLPPHDEPTVTRPHQVGISFSRHRAQEWESGGRAVRADIPAGAAFVTGEEGITWGGVAGTTEALEIYPDPDLVRRIAPGAPSIENALGVRDGVVFGIATLVKRAHVVGSGLTDVEASTLAHRLVAHVVGSYGGVRGPRRPVGVLDRRTVDRVTEYVDADLAATITLDRMADVAALSPFHFARAFKATTGLAPHRLVTARRLEAAKAALLTTDASVVRVAHTVGFSNVSHFRRVFRRELGVAPGELRR